MDREHRFESLPSRSWRLPWGCRCGRTAYHGDGRADRCRGAASVVRSDVTDRLALRNLNIMGVVQLLARDQVRGAQVEMHDVDIVAADARGYDEWPKGYGVNAFLGPLLSVAVIVLMRSNARAG